MYQDVKQITERVREESVLLNNLLNEIRKVIMGQQYLIERLIIGMLANGHVLLEGVPGFAMTMSVTTLAKDTMDKLVCPRALRKLIL